MRGSSLLKFSRLVFVSASNQNILTFFRDFTEADLARRKSSFSNDYTKITKYNVVQYFSNDYDCTHCGYWIFLSLRFAKHQLEFNWKMSTSTSTSIKTVIKNGKKTTIKTITVTSPSVFGYLDVNKNNTYM